MRATKPRLPQRRGGPLASPALRADSVSEPSHASKNLPPQPQQTPLYLSVPSARSAQKPDSFNYLEKLAISYPGHSHSSNIAARPADLAEFPGFSTFRTSAEGTHLSGLTLKPILAMPRNTFGVWTKGAVAREEKRTSMKIPK